MCMKFLSSFTLLNDVFIAFTDITITANLVAYELVILTGMNGYAHNIFEIKPLNSNSSASWGCLVCIYPCL